MIYITENDNLEKKLTEFDKDDKLKELEKELNKCNLFDILNVAHKEYIHSSVIKWLLDPKETHGLNDYFLKTFLKKFQSLDKDKSHIKDYLNNLDNFNFDNFFIQLEEVFLNKRRGDISIINEKDNLYILIENKVFSSEGKNQTEDYVKETEKRYPYYNRIYIYLTPDGSSPESKKFLIFSYKNLIEVITSVLASRKDRIDNNIEFIMTQLKRNIEVNILEDSEIEKLGLEIYKKHKKAIDKIIEIMPRNKQIYDSLGQSVVSELNEEWKYHATNSYCAIFREEWKNKHNPTKNLPFFHYEFEDVGKGQITIAIHIEKWGNKDLSEPLKNELRKTKFEEITKVEITKNAAVFLEKSVNNTEDIDKAITKGKNDMIKLIKETYECLDKASKSI